MDELQKKKEVLVAAAELKQRKHETGKRVEQLNTELEALEKVHESLTAEEKMLQQRLSIAQEDCDRVDAEVQSITRQSVELDGQIQECKREIAILDLKYADMNERVQQVSEEITSAEKAFVEAQNRIYRVTEELEISRVALERMDKKITFNKLKS